MVSLPKSYGSAGSKATPDALPGRVLAVDYGRRRIGLAISDEMRITARPMGTLERKNRRVDMARLARLGRENDVKLVIVGYPLNLDGTAGQMAQEAARFAKRVERELAVPVGLMDERLTSWEAEGTLRKKPGAKGKREGAVDALAAAILLREYLQPAPQESARRGEKE